jgi:hypothetical protein
MAATSAATNSGLSEWSERTIAFATATNGTASSAPIMPATTTPAARDRDCDEAGQQRTDDRDERTEEHHRRQRQRQRHIQDREPEPDSDGVNEGDQDRGANVTNQRGESTVAGDVNPVTHFRRNEAQQECPDMGPS